MQHEIGGGIHGTVNGHSIALGSLEWISKHAGLPKSDRSVQPEAKASPTHSQTEVRISWLRQSLPHFVRDVDGMQIRGLGDFALNMNIDVNMRIK